MAEPDSVRPWWDVALTVLVMIAILWGTMYAMGAIGAMDAAR